MRVEPAIMMITTNHKYRAIANVVLIVASFSVLCLPAILNGFPLVFSDTSAYLWPTKSPGHPPYYGVVPLILHQIISSYSILLLPALQSVAVTAMMYIAFKKLIPSAATTSILLGSLVVALLSQLPWLASWIMTDVWLGVGVLGILAIGTCDSNPSLRINIIISLLVLFSALVATSSITILAGEMLVIITLRWMLNQDGLKRFIIWCGILFVLSAAIPMSLNYTVFGKFRLNVATNAILLSRAVDLGLAQSYKVEACTLIGKLFCDEFVSLPAHSGQPFLWSSNLASKYEAWVDPGDKFGGFVRLIIKDRLLSFIQSGLIDAWRLFLTPALAHSDLQSGLELTESAIKKRYSNQLTKFRDAAQQRGRLEQLFPRAYYTWWTYFSYIASLAFCIMSWFKRDTRFFIAGVALLLVIIENNLIHALLVGPFERYHTKVSWLATFYITAWIINHYSSGTVHGTGLTPMDQDSD